MFLFYACAGIGFMDCLEKGFIIEFDFPDVTLCGWQDVKIQLLTN